MATGCGGLRLHPAVGERCRRWRGTGSSNPSPSSEESCELLYRCRASHLRNAQPVVLGFPRGGPPLVAPRRWVPSDARRARGCGQLPAPRGRLAKCVGAGTDSARAAALSTMAAAALWVGARSTFGEARAQRGSMSRTPRRYDAEQVRRFSDTTIAYYDRFASAKVRGSIPSAPPIKSIC